MVKIVQGEMQTRQHVVCTRKCHNKRIIHWSTISLPYSGPYNSDLSFTSNDVKFHEFLCEQRCQQLNYVGLESVAAEQRNQRDSDTLTWPICGIM